MEEYRKLAKLKYEQYSKQNEEFDQLKSKLDEEYLSFTFNFIVDLISLIKNEIEKNNIDEFVLTDNIEKITETITINFVLLETNNKLEEIKTNLISLVDFINNKIQYNKIKNTTKISDSFTILFDILGLDIYIEKMDVSEDDLYAQNLQNELYNEIPFQNEFPYESDSYLDYDSY
jgi:flagellin-specific chaperone FliS